MIYDSANIALIIISTLLFGFVNGYRFAVLKAEKYFTSSKRDESYKKYLDIYNEEEKFALSNLFISILCLCLYATSVTMLFRKNRAFIEEQLSEITHTPFVVGLILIFVSTLILFIFGWFFPRVLYGINTKLSVKLFAPLARLLNNIVYPIAKQFYTFAKTFAKEMFNEKSGFSDTILKKSQLSTTMIDDVLNPEYKKNKQLLDNAYDFQNKKTKYIATPRNEIYYFLKGASLEEVTKEFETTQLSKLIVCEDNIDQIIGYVHYMDLLNKPQRVEDIIKPISAVPEGMPLPSLLEKLNHDKQSIAWVIDEFGGTTGIVTTEDIYEELFGEIKDEHDLDVEYLEKKLPNNEYLFSGRLELSYIEENYSIKFGDDVDVETLSGFIIQHLNEIPKAGQKITIDKNLYTVIQVKDKKIESVKLKKNIT